MDRKLNTLFLFLLVVVFTAAADTMQQWNTLLGLLLSIVFSFGAFVLRGLTLDGMFAAIVIGTFVFGLGGWSAAVVLLLFFVISVVISKEMIEAKSDSPAHFRRDGLQVWANGLWIVICLTFAVIFDETVFLIGAMAAIATAASDTWATEIGSAAKDNTYLITDFTKVAPGTDGGVSGKGTVAALMGAAIIAAATVYVFSLHFYVFLIIFASGFLGCLFDSYFGAIFQRNKRSVMIPVTTTEVTVSNNVVNVVSTGVGSLLAIILNLIVA
ncbi:MAG: DUF92 domain-containing protein [Bacteroidota bacterium]